MINEIEIGVWNIMNKFEVFFHRLRLAGRDDDVRESGTTDVGAEADLHALVIDKFSGRHGI